MWIIGCDFHSSSQQVYGMDVETGEVIERRLSHSGDEVDQFYGGLPRGCEVGVETSGNMLWFERKLARYGHKLRIGDAAKVRASDPRKQKHDRRDAEHLFDLMRKGDFPDLQWTPTLAERDLRQLLLHRHKLVRMRARVKNQLQHIALNQGQQRKRQLWTKMGQELLKKLELEPWTARRRDDLLELLEVLNGYCEGLDAAVERAAAERAQARRLMTHPGIGPVIALAAVLTLGNIERFENSRKLVSYLGLNPTEDSSGPRRRLGAISKQGSSFLRLLLIQGAQTAAHKDAEWARQYHRLAMQKNKGIAKVMVARKLAVRVFWMLKTNKTYPELVRMRGSSSHSVVAVAETDRLSERPASPSGRSTR